MEEVILDKKSHKKQIVLLSILIIIGLGIITYILLDEKDDKKDKKLDTVVELKDLSDEKIIEDLTKDDVLEIEDVTDPALQELELQLETIDEAYDVKID